MVLYFNVSTMFGILLYVEKNSDIYMLRTRRNVLLKKEKALRGQRTKRIFKENWKSVSIIYKIQGLLHNNI